MRLPSFLNGQVVQHGDTIARRIHILSAIFLLVVGCCRVVGAEEVLDTIPKVRALSPEDADKGFKVRIEATVILYNTMNGDLMINDGNVGDFVLTPTLPAGVSLRPGDRIVVEGETFWGAFIAAIQHARVTLLGSGPLPTPKTVPPEDLFSPSLTLSWVEIPAVIVGKESGGDFFTLVAEVDGWTWRIMLPPRPDDLTQATQLMQRAVLIRGVVGTSVNLQGQMTGRLLYVQSFDQIVPSDDRHGTDTSPAPLVAVDHLLHSDAKLRSFARVQGTVTNANRDSLYLRGQGGSLLVHAATAQDFKVGDVIEVEGFAAVAPFRPILRAFRAMKLSEGPVPQPVVMNFATNKLPTLQNELVTVDATMLAQTESSSGVMIQCRSGDNFFEAFLPAKVHPRSDLLPGAKLRLTGICELEPELKDLTLESVAHIRLELRSDEDVQVINPAPWWTVQRMLWLLAIVAAAAAGAFFWVALLRRRVLVQTQIISQRIKSEATLEERQRVARELHDSIEQQLAGLSIQLGSTRKRLAQSPQEAERALELALSMLRHCREEIHTSVRDLRSVALEQRGLSGAIEELVTASLSDGGPELTVTVNGMPRPLGQVSETHLLRIAQEAVANAAKHAKAGHISVKLNYAPETLSLSIHDDGTGFAADTPAPRGHFGLIGIRERANKLKASLSIESSPQTGTTIEVFISNPDSTTVPPL